MKRILCFFVPVALMITLLPINVYAIVKGDLNNDNQVSVEDARIALRMAAGLEPANFQLDSVKLIDENNDNIISLSEVRKVLYIASNIKTSLIDGINVTILPVTYNRLTVNSLSINGNKVTLNVTNNTGKTIDSTSHILYKCYDENGTIIKSGSVFLEDINDGENCNSYFYIEENTKKIVLTDSVVYEGKYQEDTDTTDCLGFLVTKLPVTYNGLTVNSLSINGNKVTLNVTNNTGKNVDSMSHILYKCYDENGTIIKSGSVFLEDINDGENCNSYFYIEENTRKILLTNSVVRF